MKNMNFKTVDDAKAYVISEMNSIGYEMTIDEIKNKNSESIQAIIIGIANELGTDKHSAEVILTNAVELSCEGTLNDLFENLKETIAMFKNKL